jgi:predicted ATP-grasp superfamily ATP-dependent carboligase
MKESVKAVLSAYESGRSIVQKMDHEPGPRPAERLMSLATANDPEAAADAITRNSDGTYEVDTERLQDHVEGYNYDADDANEAQFGCGR